MQRAHSTQRSRSSRIWAEILSGLGKVRLTPPVSANRLSPRPLLMDWFCRGHSPPLSQTGQSSGWLMSRNSICPRCALSATGDVCWVLTTMPGATVVVHDVWGLGIGRTLPSRSGIETSTRHWRHAPTGSSSGWSQKRGISMPAVSAARMTRVPLGTLTGRPSIVRLTRSGAAGTWALLPWSTALPPEVGEVVTVMRTPSRWSPWSWGTSAGRRAPTAPAGRARGRGCACRPRTPRGSTGRQR